MRLAAVLAAYANHNKSNIYAIEEPTHTICITGLFPYTSRLFPWKKLHIEKDGIIRWHDTKPFFSICNAIHRSLAPSSIVHYIYFSTSTYTQGCWRRDAAGGRTGSTWCRSTDTWIHMQIHKILVIHTMKGSFQVNIHTFCAYIRIEWIRHGRCMNKVSLQHKILVIHTMKGSFHV